MKRQFEEDSGPECTHECHPKFEYNPFLNLECSEDLDSSVFILLKQYKEEMNKKL